MCVCVFVYASTCTRSCVVRQVSVNPIRLAGFKRCRPGTPKPVTSVHPVAAVIVFPTNIPRSVQPVIPFMNSNPLFFSGKPAYLPRNQALIGFISHE